MKNWKGKLMRLKIDCRDQLTLIHNMKALLNMIVFLELIRLILRETLLLIKHSRIEITQEGWWEEEVQQ
jgi:hypothetical protein